MAVDTTLLSSDDLLGFKTELADALKEWSGIGANVITFKGGDKTIPSGVYPLPTVTTETGTVTKGEMNVGVRTLSPKRFVVDMEISKKLLTQADESLKEDMKNSIIKGLGLQLDTALFSSSGNTELSFKGFFDASEAPISNASLHSAMADATAWIANNGEPISDVKLIASHEGYADLMKENPAVQVDGGKHYIEGTEIVRKFGLFNGSGVVAIDPKEMYFGVWGINYDIVEDYELSKAGKVAVVFTAYVDCNIKAGGYSKGALKTV